MSTPSDETLIAALRDGDTAAFAPLYRRHSRKVLGYIVRLVGDRQLAEDLLQEVFLKVLRRDGGFVAGRGSFVGWLFRVARNESLNAIRRRSREQARDEGAMVHHDGAAAGPLQGRQESVLGARQEVARALSTLSREHQDALVLNKVGGLSYREIATLQAVPEGTVKSRLHHAIRTIRQTLRPPGQATPEPGGEAS